MSTLDPQDMVAVVESSRFRTIPIHQSRRPGAMKKWVESRAMSENNGVMERPPLDIILHEDDLMVKAWGWDRLLPWITGYVHFKQYLKYLEYYLHQNHHYTSTCAAATRCLDEEKNLSDAINKVKSIHGDAGLTLKIIEQATHIVDSALECRLAAACFMCIAEEAKLMSEWLTSCTPKDHGSMVKSWQWISDFGYQVQKLTLDILTTYRGKGNNTDHVIAALLGMTKEAVTARELLKMNHAEQEKLDVCEELRGDLKDLLVLLLEKCPQDSAIDLRQNDHHVDSTTKFTHLQISDERKDDLSSHPSTPMNNSTPATPESRAMAWEL